MNVTHLFGFSFAHPVYLDFSFSFKINRGLVILLRKKGLPFSQRYRHQRGRAEPNMAAVYWFKDCCSLKLSSKLIITNPFFLLFCI